MAVSLGKRWSMKHALTVSSETIKALGSSYHYTFTVSKTGFLEHILQFSPIITVWETGFLKRILQFPPIIPVSKTGFLKHILQFPPVIQVLKTGFLKTYIAVPSSLKTKRWASKVTLKCTPPTPHRTHPPPSLKTCWPVQQQRGVWRNQGRAHPASSWPVATPPLHSCSAPE